MVARLVRFIIHLLTGNLAEVIAVSTGAAIISFLCFGSSQLWHVFNMRSSNSPLLINEISRNRFVWIAISIGARLLLSATYIPVLADVLSAVPPDGDAWLVILSFSVLPVLVLQLMKYGHRLSR